MKSRKLPSWMVRQSGATSTDDSLPYKGPEHSLVCKSKLKFEGSIVYSYNECDCALLCDDIITNLEVSDKQELLVGFDMEWPVTYARGREDKTALIQLCTSLDRCFLFQVSCMPGLPGPLKDLLNDHRVKKIGVGIESDLWKLDRDFAGIRARDIMKQSMINLSTEANAQLGSKENWSLDSLTRHLLHKYLEKGSDVRRGAWDKYPLTEEQQMYAATDAYACLLLYEELRKRKCVTSMQST